MADNSTPSVVATSGQKAQPKAHGPLYEEKLAEAKRLAQEQDGFSKGQQRHFVRDMMRDMKYVRLDFKGDFRKGFFPKVGPNALNKLMVKGFGCPCCTASYEIHVTKATKGYFIGTVTALIGSDGGRSTNFVHD